MGFDFQMLVSVTGSVLLIFELLVSFNNYILKVVLKYRNERLDLNPADQLIELTNLYLDTFILQTL